MMGRYDHPRGRSASNSSKSCLAPWEAMRVAKGKADILRKQLTLKFGELSYETTLRIAGATEVELDRRVGRVLSAGTLEAVLGV